jgi:glutamate 5-kinase
MRDFSKSKRIVIKIGTNTLSQDGGVNTEYVRSVARQIFTLIHSGKQVVLVTSGAIGMGAGRLKLPGPITEMEMRQACAAIGQPLLMAEYHKAFAEYGLICSQVLLTAEVLNNRKTYLNLRKAMETLLKLNVVPILNENDCVSTAEIGTAFGDNDKLSALVASKIDADLLIMLTDIDALYDQDPRHSPDAKKIDVVYEITPAIEQAAGSRGSMHSTGGMKTKIAAARIAADAGCRIVLAHGKVENIVERIIAGENIGTLFMPRRKLGNRDRWILNHPPEGRIVIDDGAVAALRKHKSLLPSGIRSIEGRFDAGSVVLLNAIAKAVTSFGSDELKTLVGKHSSQIRTILGPGRKDVVAVPEDIIFLDY